MENVHWRAVLTAAATLFLLGCDGADPPLLIDPYNPVIDAAEFAASIDNPFMPLSPGSRWVYEGNGERVEVLVTDETKTIMGVQCVVVRDTVTIDGELVEDTFDWYAQDEDGNVWYFGEAVKDYENGEVVSTAGSWEGGVDDAKPGIVMHAVAPPIGEAYRQEYYVGEAEDMAEIVGTAETVRLALRDYDDCRQTHEFSALDPSLNEHKYYAAGVGLVLIVNVNTGDRIELTEFEVL